MVTFLFDPFWQKTGDLYAVKVFSSRHRERLHYGESQQQEREFQLLQKLRHENIVRMLSIEEEVSIWVHLKIVS